jgi:predicted lactoylglutathione lyase
MATNIFVNLSVKDLDQSIAFFTQLGFSFNPQFTDETATCMIISDTIYAMLLTEAKFQSFTPKAISNAKQATEVLIGLSYESREQVIEMVQKAVAAGGSTYAEPNDYGFMYQHGFEDLDGHMWEIFYMDPSYVNS